MTAHELARKLLAGPDLMVTVSGYEGGVREISSVGNPSNLQLNANDAWYYGKHKYRNVEDYNYDNSLNNTQAIHIE